MQEQFTPAEGSSVGARSEGRPMAIFRLEGVLLGRPARLAAAYLAANAQGLGERLGRLGGLLLGTPLALGAQLGLTEEAARSVWAPLAGMGEDRLRELSAEYAERFVEEGIGEVGRRLVREARRAGFGIVLLSEHLDWMVEGLAERLGVERLWANRLEIKRGRATGRLLEPVIGGSPPLGWLRAEAERQGWDLHRSRAYGARAADGLLLGAVGEPCAVRPDPLLRRMAIEHDWAVVDA